MAPMFGVPNFSFLDSAESINESFEVHPIDSNEAEEDNTVAKMTFWYMALLVAMLVLWLIIYFCLRILTLRQKTHSPPRRMYVGRSAAPSTQEQSEPTIYVSPANLPPPPKYELMAPPSYEEVVGMNYPYSGSQNQPIRQPITFAVGLQNPDIAPVHTLPNYQTAIQINSSENTGINNEHVTVVTVSNERRSSAPVVT